MDLHFAWACVCQNITATLDCFQRSPGVAARRPGDIEKPTVFSPAQLYLCPDPLSLAPAPPAASSYSNSADQLKNTEAFFLTIWCDSGAVLPPVLQ